MQTIYKYIYILYVDVLQRIAYVDGIDVFDPSHTIFTYFWGVEGGSRFFRRDITLAVHGDISPLAFATAGSVFAKVFSK